MDNKVQPVSDEAQRLKLAQSNLTTQLLEVVLPQLLELQFGSLTLVVHQGQIVQIERTEKFRMDALSANQVWKG